MNDPFVISISKTCGKRIVTREDGRKVHDLVAGRWESVHKIKIDFGNVLIASVSFLDEIFGRLALEHSRDQLVNKLVLERIQEFDRALLNSILQSRYRQKAANPPEAGSHHSPA